MTLYASASPYVRLTWQVVQHPLRTTVWSTLHPAMAQSTFYYARLACTRPGAQEDLKQPEIPCTGLLSWSSVRIQSFLWGLTNLWEMCKFIRWISVNIHPTKNSSHGSWIWANEWPWLSSKYVKWKFHLGTRKISLGTRKNAFLFI